ncbi:MAG: hypothetical protein ACRD17_12730, partial [Terriglobales bacterium]
GGADPTPAAGNRDARAAVLAALAAAGKTAAITILERADWRWDGGALHLAFRGDAAPLAQLAAAEDVRKSLREACRTATGSAPELTVSSEAGGEAPPPAAEGAPPSGGAASGQGSAAARAERNPVLRQLRQQLPSHHVVRTLDFGGGRRG